MNWILFALAGSVAQLVDGSLGMGFGLTSSILLLTLGASAAVHLLQCTLQRLEQPWPRAHLILVLLR